MKIISIQVSVMTFSQKIVRAFFYHDVEEDVIKAIFCLIQKFISRHPGKANYIETRVKKYCDEHASTKSYEGLVLKIMEDINSDTWKWNDVARLFWTLNLIDDAASHRIGNEARKMFRERMITMVGEKLSFITKYEWITLPLETDTITPSFPWADAILGTILFLFVRKYLL